MADITGTELNDNGIDNPPLNGTGKADNIDGLGGDDLVTAGRNTDGPDVVNAGPGDDVVYGKSAGSAADPLNPTTDELIAATDNGQNDGGSNTLNGDDGNDILVGRENADTIHGDNDLTGTVSFSGRNASYEDVPETLQNASVTGFTPERGEVGVQGGGSDGIGVSSGIGGADNSRAIDYLYVQNSQAVEDTNGDLRDVEGGEILTYNIGTTAKSGTLEFQDLDTGERAKVTAFLDGKPVGSFVVDGSTDPNQNKDRADIEVDFGPEVLFDQVSIEALPGDADILNKSTSFSMQSASFTTVASGDDTIIGGGGNDTMKGGYGDDLFIEASSVQGNRNGNDDIDGGAGFDTVDYSDATIRGPGNKPGVMANLSDGDIEVSTDRSADEISVLVDGVTYTIDDDQPGGQEVNMTETVEGGTVEIQDNGAETVDTLTSIEKIIGSDSRQDVMVGSDGADVFAGGGRGDLLIGEGGDDTLKGEEGNDVLIGGADNDKLIGDQGDDSMLGGDGDDKAIAGIGNDTFHGGDGSDTYVVGGTVTPTPNTNKDNLKVELDDDGNGTALIDRDGDGVAEEMDQLTGVENVIGTRGNDEIRGGDADNLFNGRAGDDFLRGDGGNDTGIGGTGDDTMDGGVGYDTFKVGGRVDTKTDDGDGVGGVMVDMSSMQLDVQGANPGSAVGNAEVKVDRDGDGVFEETDIIRKVENIVTTKGNDTVIGNDDNNVIKTRAGDDSIDAGAGNDTVRAGRGDDTLSGGEGQDKLFAGKGNDMLVFDAADFTESMEVDKSRKYAVDSNGDGSLDSRERVEFTNINEKVYSGGQGYDVLKVEGDADINMLGKGISGIEAIVAGDGDQSVQANLDEIRRESDDADAARDKGFDTFTFISGGDAGDSLDLFGNGWTLAGDKLGSNINNAQATPTNKEDFLGADEVAALNAATSSAVSLQNGITAVDGAKLNVFVFEKNNGTFVTVWTDLTADQITLNGYELDAGGVA
ncbi:MAG: calcium-binding protein [Pseudomonadota bacterium]